MPIQEERPYLSDVIDYDLDIAPYRLIKIYAGVGSGKNTFVDNLVKGNVFKHSDGSFVEKKYILLITSRRAKVDEQLNSDEVVYDPAIGAFDSIWTDWFADLDPRYEDYYESPRITLPDLSGWGETEIYKRTCVNTNAKIESNLKSHYIPFEASTHPWERFDMIIIDEVHALLADASYQSAPFYVCRLIEETLSRSDDCKVIVMTGSPQILEDHDFLKQAHCIDLMNRCKNVMPQCIEFISLEKARAMQTQMLQEKEPFVAFFNHIKDMFGVIDEALPEEIRAGIAVSFSDADKRKKLKENDSGLYERMCKTERAIALEQKFPAEIKAFFTTARNKEGVNIKNEDFHIMFVEVHNDVDIIQMAGRLRNPVRKLYVITDSAPHVDTESRFEKALAESERLIPAINFYYCILCKDNGLDLSVTENATRPSVCSIDALREFIEFIHAKFEYIRYDYFTDQFMFYPERGKSKAYYAEQHRLFAEAKESRQGLVQLANQWFSGVPCAVSIQFAEETQSAVDKYLCENQWLDAKRDIYDLERKQILSDLNSVTGENSRQLKTLLRHYGYHLNTCGNKRTSLSIITVLPTGEV